MTPHKQKLHMSLSQALKVSSSARQQLECGVRNPIGTILGKQSKLRPPTDLVAKGNMLLDMYSFSKGNIKCVQHVYYATQNGFSLELPHFAYKQ